LARINNQEVKGTEHMKSNQISIVVPTYNESGNVKPLIRRLDKVLKDRLEYEIIFIDDHSTDDTRQEVFEMMPHYPVTLQIKQTQKGKAFSLLQGFESANYDLICMIDGDLQYPPEAIPKLIQKMVRSQADVVVANRIERNVPITRRVVSDSFRHVFGKLLHGLGCDVQSGLKVFRKEIIERLILSPTEWTFDLEFLVKARQAGYKIESVDIRFDARRRGQSKVSLLGAAIEIGLGAIRVKFQPASIIPINKGQQEKPDYAFHYDGTKYVHYTSLGNGESAFFSLSKTQAQVIILTLLAFTAALILNWYIAVLVIVSLLTFLYFADLIFNFYLIVRSFANSPAITVSREKALALEDESLPVYTIFCPLYKEWQVLPQFVRAIQNLDYPPEKLQVLLLLEENDETTIDKARTMTLPDNFEVVVVPHTLPKTKPKACNYGLLRARGEYSVIYDAEDVPDPLQLRKVVAAFKRLNNSVLCIQAKLNFYNPNQNLLTKLFTKEYSLWFDLVLTGLQSIKAPIPLGGTSNHFRTSDLKSLNGWDAFNVTEDCDLGIRLVKKGFQTAIINSVTLEEANSDLKNWFQQRTRWVKGYMQTYLVHMRHPWVFFENAGLRTFLIFQLVVGGKILSMLVNPFMWLMFIAYFALRPWVGGIIESFYIAPIFYMGTFSLVVGNFLYMYYYMMGAARRKQYSLIKYGLLVPLYWLSMSAAAWMAFFGLISQPHYWFKTKHGLHLNQQLNQQPVSAVAPGAEEVVPA
jgi:glycosyltransferase XagB